MKTILLPLIALFSLLSIASCETKSQTGTPPSNTKLKANIEDKEGVPEGYKVITVFMGGHVDNPTYEEVCGKKSGHIEVIRVVYDPETLSLGDALAWFWASHDPTTKDRQGNDVGPQYASAIFYETEEDKAVAETSLENAQPQFTKPIVTQIRKADTFYIAPQEHQDYYFQNQNQGYCQYVIKPKLEKLKLKN